MDWEQASKMAFCMEAASKNAAAVNNSGSLVQSEQVEVRECKASCT
jgi:hypothetical protein